MNLESSISDLKWSRKIHFFEDFCGGAIAGKIVRKFKRTPLRIQQKRDKWTDDRTQIRGKLNQFKGLSLSVSETTAMTAMPILA
jgi:hypothetical protein